jgi:hypothetical protein
MKRYITIILFLLLSANIFAPGSSEVFIFRAESTTPYEKLWQAICFVESSNRAERINIKEQAFGISQIRKIRIDDFNKRTGKNYTLRDCLSPEVSKEVFLYYCMENIEKTAKRWNGRGKLTIGYWNKVKQQLKTI